MASFIKGATVFCKCKKLMENRWRGYVKCENPDCREFGIVYRVKVTLTPAKSKA